MNKALYSQRCQKISFVLICCKNNNVHSKLVVHRRCELLDSLVSVLGPHTNAAKSVNYDLLNHSGTPTTAASSGAVCCWTILSSSACTFGTGRWSTFSQTDCEIYSIFKPSCSLRKHCVCINTVTIHV